MELPNYVDVFDTEHGNTMIVCLNKAELAYIVIWCEMNDILPPWMGDKERFPTALSVNGGGWTDSMDRALYYVRFKDFVSLVS